MEVLEITAQDCPSEILELMGDCLCYQAQNRPDFSALASKLDKVNVVNHLQMKLIKEETKVVEQREESIYDD